MRQMRQTRGVTLVEMLVAMVVLGIIGVIVVNIFRVQHQAQARQNTGVERTMNARAAVDMMAREMRNVGYDPYGEAKAGFTKTKTDEVAWTADLNGDGDTDDLGNGADEAVRYFYDKDQSAIVREVDGVESVVADNITSLAFVYLDEDMKSTGAKHKIEQVNIRITYPTPDGVMDGSMQTQVALRNTIWGGAAIGSGSGSSGSSTCDPGEDECDWNGNGVVKDDDDKEAAKLCEDAEKKQEEGLKKREEDKESDANKKFNDSKKKCDEAEKDYGVTCPVCGDPQQNGWTEDYENSQPTCSLGDETCDWNSDSSVDKDDKDAAKLCVEAREKQEKGIEKEAKGDYDKAEEEYAKSVEKCQEAEDDYGASCPYCGSTANGDHDCLDEDDDGECDAA